MTLMGVDLPLEAIRSQIASGVDILIHLGRMRIKSRKVLEITEICGFENHEEKHVRFIAGRREKDWYRLLNF